MNSAEIVRTCRERAGLSRQQLADKCGLSYSHIWRWETGQTCPKVDSLLIVINATGYEVIVKPKYEVYKKAKYCR